MTIPINQKVDSRLYSFSFEESINFINKDTIFSLSDCICRKTTQIIGRGCKHTIKNMCIQMGKYAEYYIKTGRAIRATKKQVIEVLKKSEEEGLYHEIFQSSNVTDSYFICNCCQCCCLSLRIAQSTMHISEPSHQYTAKIDSKKCINCGNCIASCPCGAIISISSPFPQSSSPYVDHNKCMGCGTCVLKCSTASIRLIT